MVKHCDRCPPDPRTDTPLDPEADTPPPRVEMVTESGGTHPSGMHSCLLLNAILIYSFNVFEFPKKISYNTKKNLIVANNFY